MKRITVELSDFTLMKLEKRAAKFGMSAQDAARSIAKFGPRFFLDRLVGATNAPQPKTKPTE